MEGVRGGCQCHEQGPTTTPLYTLHTLLTGMHYRLLAAAEVAGKWYNQRFWAVGRVLQGEELMLTMAQCHRLHGINAPPHAQGWATAAKTRGAPTMK